MNTRKRLESFHYLFKFYVVGIGIIKIWFSGTEDLIFYRCTCLCNEEALKVKDKPMTLAYVLLFTGIALLAFTFLNAYVFLISNPSISVSSDLVDVFGSALAPLIDASIRIMYLGIMGWIGAGLTSKGVQLIIQLRHLSRLETKSMNISVVKPEETTSAKKKK
jgi:hypothetical protein